MAKVRREEIVDAGLALLDEIGIDALTTRKLAQRLGIESPTLYWHFRDKAALMSAMAQAMMAKHHLLAVPDRPEQWAAWLADNARSFRGALLACRDGARLHAGTTPSGEAETHLSLKVAYLVRAGFRPDEAAFALLTTGQFALGSALDEQGRAAVEARSPLAYDGEEAFEFGLTAMTEGVQGRLATVGPEYQLSPPGRQNQ